MSVSRGAILLGQCLPCVNSSASKFKVRKMVLDTNLNMYFKKDAFIFAHDPEKICKTGDVVLIRELPKKMTKLITHAVERIVHPMGDITDPVTGKKVVVGKYRDDIEATIALYGKSDKAYSYSEAPARGRLEGSRDFTHGETYIKYHEDGKPQPFAV